MMKNAFVLGALAAMLFGCGAQPTETGSVEQEVRPGVCSILCIQPPDGCQYVGGRYFGQCNTLTCGHLRCDKGPKECPIIDCAAPPSGCHYEGMVFEPCNQQTCGTLVCDGSTL